MASWTTPHQSTHAEPALRIPNYKECVAEKGHEACANLLPSLAASSEKCLHRADGFASMAFASTAQRPAGSSSGSTNTALTSPPSEMATSSLVRLCIYVPGTFYCNPFLPV